MLRRDVIFFQQNIQLIRLVRDGCVRPGLVTWYSNFLQTLQNFSLEKANIMTLPSSASFPLPSSVGV